MGITKRISADNDNVPNLWVLTKPVIYVDNKDPRDTIMVEAGFKTNFLSVPVFLRMFISTTEAAAAGALHDGLYARKVVLSPALRVKHPNGLGRKVSDKYLYKACRDCGVGRIKSSLIYSGVRTFGWLYWKEYRENSSSAKFGE